MKQVKLEDLTAYHRAKVMERARTWRMQNHPKVMELIRGYPCGEAPKPPTGAAIFHPERWAGGNWLWFSQTLMNRRHA